jgi:hypothetical protein
MFSLLAQSTSPDEKLVNSFNSFISAVNALITGAGVIVAVLTLAVGVAAIAIPIILNSLDRKIKERTEDKVNLAISRADDTVRQAIANIEVVVQQRVQQELTTLRRRTRYLETLLEREIVIEKTTVDYYAPEPAGDLPPEGYQMLEARGFQVTLHQQLQSFTGDIVVLDLVHHRDRETLQEDQVKNYLDTVIPNIQNHILMIYVAGQFSCIRAKRLHPKHTVSANFLIALVGTMVDAAYVAQELRTSR